MLEKIGLPPKPAARGRSWVIDASHCQQCTSPFSIFNRKHHCRRCGGLFCGNCVQSRMYLRGQGDSPVRICEPCKNLEEAARFEARHGRRKKEEGRNDEDDLLKSLISSNGLESSTASNVEPVSPERLREQAQEAKASYAALKREGKAEDASKAFKRFKELERQADALALSLRRGSRKAAKASSASSEEHAILTVKSENMEAKAKAATGRLSERSSRTGEEDLMQELRGLGWSDDMDKGKSSDAEILGESEPASTSSTAAGKLQMEILGLKRKALALKREGRLVEAKEELKKAKVLERRLEEIQTLGEDVLEEEEDDDGDEITAVLKALEKEADVKQKGSGKEVPLSLPVFTEEDEPQVDVDDTDMSDPDMVAALRAMGWAEEAGVLESFSAPEASHVDKQALQKEILRHKREALALKRAGKMVEARSELKQARSLEQMLESAGAPDPEGTVEDNEDVEVNDQDMRDPEMLAALQALGFREEDVKKEQQAPQEEAAGMKARQDEVDPIKPMKMPATSYVVHEDDDDDGVQSLKADPELAAALKNLNLNDGIYESLPPPPPDAERHNQRRQRPRPTPTTHRMPQRSKLEIQRELLGRKRKALALRRAGKEDEAEKELKDASVLEAQLKALEDAERPLVDDHEEDDDDEEEQTEVTLEDMNDPAMLAALRAMGLEEAPTKPDAKTDEEENSFEGEYGEIGLLVDIVPPFFSKATTPPAAPAKQPQDLLTGDVFIPAGPEKKVATEPPLVTPDPRLATRTSTRSIEQDILEHKRRALQFKRSGDAAAAKEELRQAKILENQRQPAAVEDVPRPSSKPPQEKPSPPASQTTRPRDRMKIQQESLAHKRRAMALRKEGKMDEAEAEFEIAKSLEQQLEEMDPPRLPPALQATAMDGVEELLDPQLMAALSGLGWRDDELNVPSSRSSQQHQQPQHRQHQQLQPQPQQHHQQQSGNTSSSQELQDRVKKLKVRAVQLKRAGKQREALEVLREAKTLEKTGAQQ